MAAGGEAGPAVCPKQAKVAGFIWVLFGCVIAFTCPLTASLGQVWFLQLVFGFAFARAGSQTVWGAVEDTLGSALGSLMMGSLGLCLAVVGFSFDEGLFIPSIALVFSLALIAAGILALNCREEYRTWRKAKQAF